MRITRSASKFEKRGIHLAVVQQDMPALSAAVAAPGAAINAALDGGVTALHIACAMNQVEDGGAMRLLLDRGADVNAHLSSNGLEIDLALRPIKQQNAPLFQQLVRRLQPLFSPLAVAVHSLHVGAVEVLLAGGADAGHVVHGRNLLNICQAASTWYSSATVTRIQALLVQHGVDCLGGYPAPPLGCAVDRHEREAVRIYMADLCRRQAAGNLLADDPVGWRLVTIMKAALMVKDAASLELFSPFIRRQDGCRAQYVSGGMVRLLEPAILADNLDVCGRLLDVGVSATDTIDHFWGRGNRPLDVAVAHSGEGIVRLLMEHGAQPEAKHILSAVSYWKPGVLRALLSGGTPQFDLSHVDARAVGSTFTCPVIELLYRHVQRGGRGVGAVAEQEAVGMMEALVAAGCRSTVYRDVLPPSLGWSWEQRPVQAVYDPLADPALQYRFSLRGVNKHVWLVAQALPWSPARHAKYPWAFRRAVQTLLLVGRSPLQQGRSRRGRAATQNWLALLPQEAILHIAALAAQPLTTWL